MIRTKACVIVTAVALSLSAQADAGSITDTTQVIGGTVDLLAARDRDDEDRRSVARQSRVLFPSEHWPPRDHNDRGNGPNGRGRGNGGPNGRGNSGRAINSGPNDGPHSVPDGGTTAVLLAAALCGIEMFRRRARRP